MADGRAVAAVMVVLVFGVAVAAWAVLARSIDVSPMRTEEGQAAAGTTAAVAPAAPAATAAPQTVPAVREQAAGDASVRGVVLDARGNPLAEVDVALELRGVSLPPKAPDPRRLLDPPSVFDSPEFQPKKLLPTRSGANGEFAYDGLAAGDYMLSAVLGIATSQDLKLRPGEVANVELRFAGPEVLVFGDLRYQGQQGTVQVTLQGGGLPSPRPAHVGLGRGDGFRCLVPPGNYLVRALSYPANRVAGAGATRLVAAERRLLVPADAVSVRCDLDVLDFCIDVRIDGAGEEPIAGLEFELTTAEVEGQVATRLGAAAVGGRSAQVRGLGLGEWTILARAPTLLPCTPMRCELTLAAPQASVVLPVQLGGVVRLVARGRADSVLLTRPALPILVTSRGELKADNLRHEARGLVLAMTGEVGFAGVPLGRAELRILDHVVPGQVTFLPFEPVASQTIEVIAGDHNRVELELEYRAFVKLRVVDAVGRDDFTVTKLTVFDGEREVLAESPRATRWRSSMPPGDYLIEIERRTGQTRQRLQVGRQDLELTLRP